MELVKELIVNGNETRAQRRVPASIDSLSVYQLDLLPFPFSISDPAGVFLFQKLLIPGYDQKRMMKGNRAAVNWITPLDSPLVSFLFNFNFIMSASM